MPDSNAFFNISMSNSTRGGNTRAVSLRIEDRLSGETLCDVDLTTEQFTAMVGNSYLAAIPGTRTPHPERLGLVNRVEGLSITNQMLGVDAYRDGADDAAQKVAKEHLSVLNDNQPGWTMRHVSKTNYGYRAVFDRWEEPTEADLEKVKARSKY